MGFVFVSTGELKDDADAYDSIARSIVAGQGFSQYGQPSMEREPGYPLFRAFVYWLGGGVKAVEYVQILLVVVTVFLVGLSFLALDPVRGWWAAWGASIGYGYLAFAAQGYVEALVGLLITFLAWLAIRCRLYDGRWRPYFLGLMVIVGAFLTLTRVNMILIAPALFFVATWLPSVSWKKRFGVLAALVLSWIVLIVPWIVRNGVIFGEWNIVSRSGRVIYARYAEVREPASRLGSTFASVVLSRTASSALGGSPLFVEQWEQSSQRFGALKDQGLSWREADQIMQKEAIKGILSGPASFVKYGLWTVVNVLRLWAWSSPGTPTSSIENSFYPAWEAGQLGLKEGLLLFVFHVIQLVYWVLLTISLYVGWRRFRWAWVPLGVWVALTVVDAPFDLIVRYSVPALPLMLGAIAWFLATWMSSFRRSDVS